MKAFWLGVLSAVVVGVAFGSATLVEPIGWHLLAMFGAYILLNMLFVQKYPRSEALRHAVTGLKPGQKIEVEGK